MMNLRRLLSIGLIATIGLTSSYLADYSAAAAAPTKRPYRRASGGKRGVCRTTPTPPTEELMAFLPDRAQGPDLSASKAPAFYFYVPDQPANVASLEFRLDYATGDKRGDGVISPPLNVPIGQTPGVVKVQLPEVLEKDTTYAWSFTLRCNGSRETVSFKGLIAYQPIDSAVATKIAQASTALQKSAIYTEAGFLVDATSILLESTESKTKSLAEIIAEIGLEAPKK